MRRLLDFAAKGLNKIPELLTPKEYREDEQAQRQAAHEKYKRRREAEWDIELAQLAYDQAKEEYRIAVRKQEMGEAIRRAHRRKAIQHRLR